ncbi:hypothetical protein [Streptomyces canus]|uniref:hypothetical protein n=1 Tax=Streptomyces canus TaxID=58343 RepID=UPI002E32245F|nr:hypothetical protein [Streptomyces canus]
MTFPGACTDPDTGEIGLRHLHVVAAERTLAGLLPHRAGLKDLHSLNRARAQVTALAA